MKGMLLAIGLVWGVAILIGVVVYFIKYKTTPGNRELQSLRAQLPSRKRQLQSGGWGNLIYPHIDRIPLVNLISRSIRRRLVMISAGDERDIRESASRYTVYTVAVGIAFFSASKLLTSSIQGMLMIMLAGIYMMVIIFELAVSKSEKIAMIQQLDAVASLKDEYNSSRMVIVSLNRAADKSPSLVASQLRKISKVLSGRNPDAEIVKYYDVAPNDYMRKVAGTSYNILTYGDNSKNENSRFILSMSHVSEELSMEITNRDKLDYRTSGFKFMIIVPVFLLDPLKAWTQSNMVETREFFESSLGLYGYVAIYTTIILSFIGVQMARSVASGSRATKDEGVLAAWILEKSSFIRRMVERYAPTKGDSLRIKKLKMRSDKILQPANSSLTVSQLYLRKLMFGLFGFILVIAVQFSGTILDRTQLLDKAAVAFEPSSSQEYTEKDKRIFEAAKLQEYENTTLTDEEIRQALELETDGRIFAIVEEGGKAYADQVLDRITELRGKHVKWYHLLIACLFSVLFYMLPNLFLYARATLRKQEMQKEVDGFYTLLIILTKNKRAMVGELLEELHRYSSIFERQLSNARVRYPKGQMRALEKLGEEVNFKSMEQIVERLKSCVTEVEVEAAFADLEGNRKYSLENRELNNEKSLNQRVGIATALGSLPMGMLLFCYLMLPIGLMVVAKLADFGDVLNFFGTGGQ